MNQPDAQHNIIEKHLLIEQDPQTVFEILTTEKHIVNYFPLESVSSTWQVDNEILLRGTIEGKPFCDHGIIEQFDPGQCFAYRYWSDNHGTERLPQHYVSIRYQLTPQAQGCLLTLTQQNLPNQQLQQIMQSAWDFLLDGLKRYTETL